ncbi:MAG TPA: GDP-L-fucose synthase [Geminicoccaceae bacterium]|nr:GDP-L-fucose synthase [Geminicoccus sp.]HMU48571.1 GDP-L-fucose synthase [Geminicoccaceae bacterium]
MTPPLFELAGRSVFVAGHRGMVGSALVRRLEREPVRLLTADRAELDLTRQAEVERWMAKSRPEVVIVAAAKVGGILANDRSPADFLADNLLIETNLIRAAHEQGVAKLLFLGSSCIYPRLAPQPLKEDALLTGPLEPTNEWYAVAKIAGIKLCAAHRRQHGRDFISAMPTNLYGPHDNFDLESSHVVPALMRKMHEAKLSGAAEVEIWGTGTPRRELLHVADLAEACLFLLRHYSDEMHVNVGCGTDLTVRELALTIREVVGFDGELRFDPRYPDGTPRKLMDVSRLTALGWRPGIELRDGLASTYAWYVGNTRR